MKLSVRHTTRYSFDPALHGVIQLHRLVPSACSSQLVQAWSVETAGATRGARYRDGAGDMVELISLRGAVKELAVEVSGEVETFDTSGVLRDHRERIRPSVYLRKTDMTRISQGMSDLAHETVASADNSVLGKAHALMAAVADAVAYEPGRTEAGTTAIEAFELGAGVCQDHAHILIGMARKLEIPARYVIGYLNATEDGTPHEAAHAWAELHVPDLGWVGFDPSNRCSPNEHYIRLGSGFDALDAAPIRGLTHGLSSEDLDVTLEVEATQQ